MTNDTPKILRVSYSSSELFLHSCERKFEFRKLYPRKEIQEDFYAANVGKALHAAAQNYLINGDKDKALWELLKTFPHEQSFYQIKNDRDINAAIATLDEMLSTIDRDRFSLAQIKKPNGEIVPAVEVPFSIKFLGIDIPGYDGVEYTGFIDAIMVDNYTGHYRTRDIKTHRRYSKDAEAEYLFSNQQIPYGLIVEHIADQTIETFDVLYLDCFVDILNPTVQEFVYTKTRSDVERWLLDTVIFFQQLQRAVELNHFRRTGSGCSSWNKPCGYLPICHLTDKEALTDWFLMGNNPAQEPEFEPWITAEIDPFDGAS